jgi:hypothetical protein
VTWVLSLRIPVKVQASVFETALVFSSEKNSLDPSRASRGLAPPIRIYKRHGIWDNCIT